MIHVNKYIRYHELITGTSRFSAMHGMAGTWPSMFGVTDGLRLSRT